MTEETTADEAACIELHRKEAVELINGRLGALRQDTGWVAISEMANRLFLAGMISRGEYDKIRGCVDQNT